MKIKVCLLVFVYIACTSGLYSQNSKKLKAAPPAPKSETKVWSAEKANVWYNEHNWITGANFIPSNAINQFEMWQEDSFDPETIDQGIGICRRYRI